jgi:hypothetical protein
MARLLDQMMDHLFVVFVVVLVALLEWWRFFSKMAPHPGAWSIAAIAVSVWPIRKIIALRAERRSLEQGRDGERFVGQELEALRQKGFRILHDFGGEGFNIDHILMNEKGIFTVETKTISKPQKGPTVIVYDGETVVVDGFTPDRNPIVQAKSQAQWLRELIRTETGKVLSVRPVVIYPGWFISKQPHNAEVWVLNDKALPSFLEHQNVQLKTEDVELIYAHLAAYERRKKEDGRSA